MTSAFEMSIRTLGWIELKPSARRLRQHPATIFRSAVSCADLHVVDADAGCASGVWSQVAHAQDSDLIELRRASLIFLLPTSWVMGNSLFSVNWISDDNGGKIDVSSPARLLIHSKPLSLHTTPHGVFSNGGVTIVRF